MFNILSQGAFILQRHLFTIKLDQQYSILHAQIILQLAILHLSIFIFYFTMPMFHHQIRITQYYNSFYNATCPSPYHNLQRHLSTAHF